MMGTLEQKMYIAFRCYDEDNDEIVNSDEIKIILRNIPLFHKTKCGHGDAMCEDTDVYKMPVKEYVKLKNKD